jgi:hypothetical protein
MERGKKSSKGRGNLSSELIITMDVEKIFKE